MMKWTMVYRDITERFNMKASKILLLLVETDACAFMTFKLTLMFP